VEIVIDASSVINLSNAHALELVARLDNCTIWLPPLVLGECHSECVAELLRLKNEHVIHFVEPDSIPAESYLELLSQHELGEGETECLAICLAQPHTFCCDDRRARAVGALLLGEDRVVGTLRLLKWSVSAARITDDEAFALYEAMKAAGGFLPEVTGSWFASE
jgi:predicted nucleic acid-binding protein